MFLRVIYDDDTQYILDLIPENIYVESYNIDFYKEFKKALPIMVRNGTKNIPLVILVEDGEETKVIWSETNPDWKTEINKLLNK